MPDNRFRFALGRVVFLRSSLVILNFFSSRHWQSWGLEHPPLIPERMPVLIDDDLLFDDGPAVPPAATAVNRWLRELPSSGAPATSSWESYARVLKAWMEFLAGHGVGLFDSRGQLKYVLGKYAEHRATGPMGQRFSSSTWGQHMSVLSLFYRWAIAEDLAQAEPFTYRTARALFAGTGREVRVNLAVRRRPKPHVTIKYLEPDFTALFLQGLRGLGPDGRPTVAFGVGNWHATARSASWRWPPVCAFGSSATCCPTRSQRCRRRRRPSRSRSRCRLG